jgi:hypothetical protein
LARIINSLRGHRKACSQMNAGTGEAWGRQPLRLYSKYQAGGKKARIIQEKSRLTLGMLYYLSSDRNHTYRALIPE